MIAKILVPLALAALAFAAPRQIRGAAGVISSCTVPNTVALTFDDGPYKNGKAIADILTKHKVHGTFFYNGNNWACIYDYADTVQYVYNKGHQIASHTWSHAHLNTLDEEEITDEMTSVDEALERITGVLPAFFRPPYGEYDDLVLEVAGRIGETAVLWDMDSGDSAGASVGEQEARYNDVVDSHPSTLLSLEHETYDTTPQVVEYAIKKLQAAGYKLVTVAQCVGEKPYRKISAPQQPDSDWHC